jgi:hypothetical protein
MANVAGYTETVWTISRRRFNLRFDEAVMYVLCSYLLRVYSLQAAVVIQPVSGASVGVPVTSFQLSRRGNLPKR